CAWKRRPVNSTRRVTFAGNRGMEMNTLRLDPNSDSGLTRVWYQSFVDPQEQQPYIRRLQERLAAYAGPGISFAVHCLSPPDRYLSPMTECRFAAHGIREAIQAQEHGSDAFLIGHCQEPGLVECRCAVDIPVVGLGEATMLQACTLGRAIGRVPINPVFIPWH